MKWEVSSEVEPNRKKIKLQQTLTSMILGDHPKFVETVGVQLVCPYCNYKWRCFWSFGVVGKVQKELRCNLDEHKPFNMKISERLGRNSKC